MTQDQWMLLALKIVLVADVAVIAVFAVLYHRWTAGDWRRDHIGVTLMAKALLLMGVTGLTVLNVFFMFGRQESRVAAWIQITMLALLAVVYAWRTVVFGREKDGPRRR